MQYPDNFFEDEVRCGFYVPSEVKRAWAVGLEVLQEMDRICRKHNIEYWVDWGTLIGAVRHGGFIPWDDDIDVSMKRADYRRFMQVAFDEIGDRFNLYTYRENSEYWGFVTRMVVKDRICFEPEHLIRCHEFPYIAGIDIFIWDYVDRNQEKEAARCNAAKTIIEFADEACEQEHDDSWIRNGLELIRQKTGRFFSLEQYKKDKVKFRVLLYELAEEYFAMVEEKDADIITRMMPNGLYYNTTLRIPKKYFDDIIYVQFEDIKVPVPLDYDEMLRLRYGDYMKLVKNQSGHDYPFFASQEKKLFELFDRENIEHKKSFFYDPGKLTYDDSNSYKSTITACLTEMKSIPLDRENSLVNLQQYAIELGGFIESIKGEGTESVHSLEVLCEAVFNAFENRGTLERVTECLQTAEKTITEQILSRKLSVFLVTKADKWKYYSGIYEERKKNNEVIVVPVPYFHKRYDGTFSKEFYEGDLFKNICDIKAYDRLDLSLLMPDEIIIEVPFDEYNSGISVLPYFYTANIKKYTKKLIYIPDFIVDDFDAESEREYINMQHYCLVPGVAYADEVYVKTEKNREMYIRKLSEFADNPLMWQEKIKINPWSGCRGSVITLTENIKSFINDNSGRKKILYFCGISELLHNKELYIEKLNDNLEIFRENAEKIIVFFTIQDGLKEILQKKYPKLEAEIEKIIEMIKKDKQFLFISNKDLGTAAEICDAYYGDVNSIIQNFRNNRKPVMIQKVL